MGEKDAVTQVAIADMPLWEMVVSEPSCAGVAILFGGKLGVSMVTQKIKFPEV